MKVSYLLTCQKKLKPAISKHYILVIILLGSFSFVSLLTLALLERPEAPKASKLTKTTLATLPSLDLFFCVLYCSQHVGFVLRSEWSLINIPGTVGAGPNKLLVVNVNRCLYMNSIILHFIGEGGSQADVWWQTRCGCSKG